MKRKLPVDAQLLSCAQEELEVKKRLVDRMDRMNNQYVENMKQMTQNMEKLTESIAEGFSLLKSFLVMHQPYQPHPPYHSYNFQGSSHAFSQRMPSYPAQNNYGNSSPHSPYNVDWDEN